MFALADINSFYASCEKVFRPDLRNEPVIVLSNNDGCVIARSPEAKALGIRMGQPWFQVRQMRLEKKIHVFSSNYALYHSMSQRVMAVLESLSPAVEPYSIDEMFIDLRGINRKRLVRTVLIFTESSDQLSRATDRVPGLPASPGYVQ